MLELSLGDRFKASNSMIDVDTKSLPPSGKKKHTKYDIQHHLIFNVIMVTLHMTFLIEKKTNEYCNE